MVISSRTPEGDPLRCPVCGKTSSVEPSYPDGDACCPSCGQLLWWFRDRLSQNGRIAAERITLSTSFVNDLGVDSLEVVELVMEMEEEFDITISDEEAERIHTVSDAIRYIERQRGT